MLRGNKLYWPVNRNENSPDTVTIDRQVFAVRFSATHAEHIVENLTDPTHRIGFWKLFGSSKSQLFCRRYLTRGNG